MDAEESGSGNSEDYVSGFSGPYKQPASSLVVQPILISSSTAQPTLSTKARGPPSLIPISSFANQFRAKTQNVYHPSSGVQNIHLPSSLSYSGQQTQSGMDIDEAERQWEETPLQQLSSQQRLSSREVASSGSYLHHPVSVSTSPLVSTSSHSVESGVKLHIHRAPARPVSSNEQVDRQRPDNVESNVYTERNPQEYQGQSSINAPSNLDSILNAIRNNTSLTIEEVPATSTYSHVGPSQYENSEENISRSAEFVRGGGNDKVEVFIVPQKTPSAPARTRDSSRNQFSASPSVQKSGTRGRRGRPKRIPAIAATPNEGQGQVEETPDVSDVGSGSRRTARDRKPTKHFMPDFSRFRGFKKRGLDLDTSKNNDADSLPAADSEPEEAETPEASSETVTPRAVKRRGRPSTGRARGRPRGSTRKPIVDKDNASAGDVEESDNSRTRDTPEVENTPGTNRGNVGDEGSVSRKLTVTTPRGTRAARGGARGGRRITKAQKIQKAKLKKLLSNRKDSLQLFEEETRMSSDVKTAIVNAASISAVNTATAESDASNSTNTSSNTKQKKQTKANEIEVQRPVTADTLFEYHWPVDDPLAEIFFLQEQVSEYLGVKSFKRKYPDLKRRSVEMAERDFLRGHKVVSETQCDLGLTALYSNHVLEIMFNDFPDKYEEYRAVVQERRDREFVKQKAQQSTTSSTIRDKGAEFLRRAINSAASWNSKLNRERIEERSCCYDQQTLTMNIQKSKMRVLPPHATKIGYYPVSVLPGQFTDNFIKYSPDELKYLPLNTVSFGPVFENQFNRVGSDDSSDSDGSSSSSDDSSSSSDSEDESEREKQSFNGNTSGNVTSIVSENGVSGGSLISCKTCEGTIHKNKDGQFEVLIQCTKCDVANHPSCLELSLDMLPFITKYNWQCTDCKNCIECNDPADEDKMLFCDLCDRGYHIYCVGLRKVPTGRWHCRVCSICHSCGTTKSASDERGTEWHHEFKKGDKGTKIYSHSICITCHKLFKKGQFCPTCNKSHLKIDEKTLLECRACEKWMHKDCVKRPLQPMFGIMCDPCDEKHKTKGKTSTKDSFVKQNFYFY